MPLNQCLLFRITYLSADKKGQPYWLRHPTRQVMPNCFSRSCPIFEHNLPAYISKSLLSWMSYTNNTTEL